MRVKKVKKLWQGKYVSVRDYEIESAIKKGGLVIIHSSKKMTVDKDGCEKILQHGVRSQKFKSKTGGKDYQLIDITFAPDGAEAQNLLI